MAHATHSYDVLIIGAGGAGLRAAIEAANAGVSVGLICKSLLGKAHTVMAEGGMAAAMGHNDDRDNWRVHFADTMRGGQYVNNWRMAEIHAKEAPDRVRELEAWGAVFDRTERRPDQPAQLRRPPLSAAGARRRPHRPRADPRAAGPHDLPGRRRPHGAHGHRPRARFGPRRGRPGLRPPQGRVPRVLGEGDHPGHRRRRTRLQDHEQQLGRHRRRPRAGVPRRRRADRHGVHPVPSDRHGLAAERPGHPRDGRACAAKAGSSRTARAAASCSTTSPTTTSRRRRRMPKKGGATPRATSRRGARPSCSRATTSRAASTTKSRRAAAPRTAASSSTSPGSRRSCRTRRRTSSASCRACTTSSSSSPTSTSRRKRWRSVRRRTTSWAGSGSTPIRRCRRSRGCSPRGSARPASTAPTASAAIRSRT